ncbi:hypothetical protein JHK82_050172 [Glycine max]|nr:hypothetical protein JHK82_050172 [Glycine max]
MGVVEWGCVILVGSKNETKLGNVVGGYFGPNVAIEIIEAYEGTLEDDYPPENEWCEHGEMLLYKVFPLDVAATISFIGTIAMNDYLEADTIVFLFSIAECLESRASHKTPSCSPPRRPYCGLNSARALAPPPTCDPCSSLRGHFDRINTKLIPQPDRFELPTKPFVVGERLCVELQHGSGDFSLELVVRHVQGFYALLKLRDQGEELVVLELEFGEEAKIG